MERYIHTDAVGMSRGKMGTDKREFYKKWSLPACRGAQQEAPAAHQVTEGYLTCGPDDDGWLMSGPYSCTWGGVPCSLPVR